MPGRQPVLIIPTTVAALNKMDMGMIHVAGMIILGCEAMFAGKNVFMRNPETYLHPATERYILGMFQKMLQLCGGKGTVTKTDKAPKNLTKSKKRPTDKAPHIDSPEKLKTLVIEWLGCMTPTKQIVQRPDGTRLTPPEVEPMYKLVCKHLLSKIGVSVGGRRYHVCKQAAELAARMETLPPFDYIPWPPPDLHKKIGR